MYGQAGLSEINAAVALSTTAASVAVTAAEWAPGIWGGAEKKLVDITNAGMSSVLESGVIVDAVDFDNKTLSLKLSTGTYTTVVGTKIIPHGALGKQMKGLHAIMTEASDLFGINPSAYSLFKATQYSASSAVLSFNVLQKAIAKAVARGLKGNVIALVNPEHWDDLLTESMTQRMFDSSYSTKNVEKGAESITFYAQCGKVTIIPSIYCKQGKIAA